MTMLDRLGGGITSRLVRNATEFKLKSLTKRAVSNLKKQSEEVTLEKVMSKFEGLDKLAQAGFSEEWIRETIEKEIRKCM